MRALVEEPNRVDAARYRRFLRRAELEGSLADHLVDGEPYLALNAVVLEADEDALLKRLTRAFVQAFDAAGQALHSDVPGLVDMGFPWEAAELLAAEPPRTPIVGRFDFARDRAGRWFLLEYNADTPSGIREGVVGDRLVHDLLPSARDLELPNSCLGGLVAEAFDRAAPADGPLGLVTAAAELEDLCQSAFLAELLRPVLERRGVEIVLGDADNLVASGRGVALRGRRLASLYRLLPLEATLMTPPMAAAYGAVLAGRLTLLNGLYGLLLQHKGVMAFLWAHRDDPSFPAEARAAIANHLPPTWAIDDCPADERREDMVAKQVFGREGEEVHFGEDLDSRAWDELRRRRTYVAQRRVDVLPVAAAVTTSTGSARWTGAATVGVFTAGGDWAGYYTRFGGRLTTRHAKWLATLVA